MKGAKLGVREIDNIEVTEISIIESSNVKFMLRLADEIKYWELRGYHVAYIIPMPNQVS